MVGQKSPLRPCGEGPYLVEHFATYSNPPINTLFLFRAF